VVVPEQGMRLQVAAREGVTQLDPQKSGLKQKGVLAFRVLQTPWGLSLDVEQVDAWVQVTSLQHAMVGEAQVKVGANLQYQIENTGLKAFRVSLPANAESVRFAGDQVADFLIVPNAAADGMQMWEVKLHRRVIGPYFLHASYQTPVAANAVETSLRGLQGWKRRRPRFSPRSGRVSRGLYSGIWPRRRRAMRTGWSNRLLRSC
jgi:hypothetical protein